MGRKQETGLPYAPIDVDILTDDDRIKILRIRYGSSGVLLWIYILTRIYRNGYYLPVTKDFYEIAASDVGVKPQLVEQVIAYCTERSLLDSKVFHAAEVLTSSGIQRRWQKAIQSRAQKTPITVDARIWLLSADETFNGVRGNYTLSEDSSEKKDDSSAKNCDFSAKNQTRMKNEDINIHSFNHSIARTREEFSDGAEPQERTEAPITKENGRRLIGGTLGGGLVMLSDEQMDDLLEKLSKEEFDYYVGVIRDAEAAGHHYRRKTHYQAILDMAEKDRRKSN